jgi:transcriptional regulator with XRE-family HTH domain
MEKDRMRWMAELLATSIQVSGLSEEELERRLGWKPGSVGRILDGESDLDPNRVLEMLSELNESAETGLSLREPEDDRTQVVTDLLERFQDLGYKIREVPPPDTGEVDLASLETKLESLLQEAFGKQVDRKKKK